MLTSDPLVLPDRTPQDRETRYNAIGRNEEGRHVFIVFALRERDSAVRIRPIARFMHRKEIESFERQTEKGS